MIEVLRLSTGKLLLSVGRHCVETDADDRSVDAAVKRLAELSGVDRNRISIFVARATLSDV
jgi:hypothetical protein